MELQKFAKNYFEKIKKTISKIDKKKINEIVKALLNAYRRDKQIFIFGNGGSAATASHFACDLGKGAISGCEPWNKKILKGKKRFKVICLNDNIPLMTAWANDIGYENIFSEQLENLVESGDIVIGITGSGTSKNILNAIKLANEKNAITIGMTGYTGGKLKDIAKICIIIPCNSMRMIEDIHLIIEHLITEYIYREFKKV